MDQQQRTRVVHLRHAGARLPTLGLGALAVFVDGVASQLYDGYQSWSLGDRKAAVRQFFAVAANLAAGLLLQRIQGRLLSGLHIANGRDGQPRLWRHDRALWHSDAAARHIPSAPGGAYSWGTGHWVRLEEDEVVPVVGQGQELALHVPANHSGIVPELVPAPLGRWQWAQDSPLARQGINLLRAFADLPEAADDQDMLDALRLSGVPEQRLRMLAEQHAPLPGALRYWLRERALRRGAAGCINALRQDGVMSSTDSDTLLTLGRLPGWPQGLGLDYERPQGVLRIGTGDGPAQVVVQTDDFTSGAWSAKLLAVLTDEQRQAIAGSPVPDQQSRALAWRWADYLHSQVSALMPLWLGQPEVDEAGITVLRSFPSLPVDMAQDVVNSADPEQMHHLTQGKLVPGLALKALEQSRRLRAARALVALENAEPGDDADRLFMANLARLPEWPSGVHLRLESTTFEGAALGDAGPGQGVAIEIRRFGSEYKYNQAGAWSPPATLEMAIHDALAPAARQQLFKGETPQWLRNRVVAQAWEDVGRAQRDLGIRPSERYLLRPVQRVNGALGYPLSGRFSASSLLMRSSTWRLRRLFPWAQGDALAELRQSLVADSGLPLADTLTALEEQRLAVDAALREWRFQASLPDAEHPQDDAALATASQSIMACWRRETYMYGYDGARVSSLRLSYLPLSNLPALNIEFAHVRILELSDMALSSSNDAFLRCFPNVHTLILRNNPLQHLPTAIQSMRHLVRLDLGNTQLSPSPDMFDVLLPQQPVLEPARPLQSLDISGLHTVDAQALGKLAELSDLRIFRWNHAGEMAADHLAAIGKLLHLRTLMMESSNLRIPSGSEGFIAGLSELHTLDLWNNPLGRAPDVTGLENLVNLNLEHAQLTELPRGLGG
ncbi:hypothetical protein LN139_10095 [Pseudomonas sp. KNUC1026]|nr:hypothetical protein LN139_10095 [Pseudomonas sp. KNUC1026]